MICKYCGAGINTSRMICDQCGRTVAIEAGNGFWDLKSCPQQSESSSQVTEKGVKKEAVRISKIPIILCAVFFVLCAAILLISEVSNGKMLQDMERNYAAQMEEQKVEYQARLDALASENEELRAEVSKYDTMIKENDLKEYVWIRIAKASGHCGNP